MQVTDISQAKKSQYTKADNQTLKWIFSYPNVRLSQGDGCQEDGVPKRRAGTEFLHASVAGCIIKGNGVLIK